MISKRSLLACLLGLNCILAAVFLVGSVTSSPQAFGQAPAVGSSNTICVTAKASGQTFDVVYLLDVQGHKLHAFLPSGPQTRQLAYGGVRDLERDLGR